MTTKLRSLGEPRLGIALIWLVPSQVDGEPRVMAPVTEEELEHFRQVTGVDAEELTSRLQAIAAEYQRNPEVMRAEILRITGGNERMADFLVELMQAAQPDGSDDGSGEESGEVGKVIDFRRPDTRGEEEDDDGGEPR